MIQLNYSVRHDSGMLVLVKGVRPYKVMGENTTEAEAVAAAKCDAVLEWLVSGDRVEVYIDDKIILPEELPIQECVHLQVVGRYFSDGKLEKYKSYQDCGYYPSIEIAIANAEKFKTGHAVKHPNPKFVIFDKELKNELAFCDQTGEFQKR